MTCIKLVVEAFLGSCRICVSGMLLCSLILIINLSNLVLMLSIPLLLLALSFLFVCLFVCLFVFGYFDYFINVGWV